MIQILLTISCTFVQIRWEDRRVRDNGSICKVSVDGTDFQIPTTLPYDRSWFSHKFRKPGVRYEVGIAIQTGWIVWIHGPFKAGVPDINIFRSKILKKLKEANERAETDDGYAGEPSACDLPKEMLMGSPGQYKRKALVRSRHETCNKRFKQFGCLKSVFRHDLRHHKNVFTAIAVLTQLSIVNGNPLFQVEYKTKKMPRSTKLK